LEEIDPDRIVEAVEGMFEAKRKKRTPEGF
jgi:hypothetical protein